jgi:hypothetical protein
MNWRGEEGKREREKMGRVKEGREMDMDMGREMVRADDGE